MDSSSMDISAVQWRSENLPRPEFRINGNGIRYCSDVSSFRANRGEEWRGKRKTRVQRRYHSDTFEGREDWVDSSQMLKASARTDRRVALAEFFIQYSNGFVGLLKGMALSMDFHRNWSTLVRVTRVTSYRSFMF